MKPRASASFCHWPNDTSTPPGQVGPSCVSRPAGSRVDHVVGAGARDRGRDRRLVVEPRHVAEADGVPRPELEAEEILERAGQPRPPLVGAACAPAACRRRGSRPEVGSYIFAEQLDERGLAGAVLADDRDDGAGRQRRPTRRRARGATCPDTRTTRDRGGCPAAATRGAGRSAAAASDGRVVLEPREPPGAVHPEAAQESDLADGRADVGGQPRAGRQHQQHLPGRRAQHDRDEHHRADVGDAEHRPRERVPQRRSRSGRRHRLYQRSQAARRPATSRLADSGDAHFLARRRRRRGREEMAGQAGGLRAALLRRALDSRAARSRSSPSASQRRPAAPARDESTPAARSSRRAAESTRHVENTDMYM